MFSLAALKYRNVLADFGGPIARVVTSPISICGVPSFQANAYLIPAFRRRSPINELYGDCDGTGESSAPQVARHKAISEALERWAHRILWHSPDAKRYGFDVDPSSSGMAAFPGLFKRNARATALLESIERFSLMSWWDRRSGSFPLPVLENGIQSIRLENPAGIGEVVVAYRRSPTGHVAYGHAAAKTIAEAQSRAVVELMRTDFVLSRHKLLGGNENLQHFFERRCVYFASEAGHQEFLARLAAPSTKPLLPWVPVFDGEIPGPWSKYATIWRVAAAMPTPDYLNQEITNFFFW